ncbi:uncharacterized protein KGF55_002425 [Candida pseudojiufengensis]|uniref:uncharacterized protein n=1 Tax=Candida pseudojiufengensis TaxID=497109 RepID=UPI002224BC10|nr:uncharacterized protein KGF55_002425 [Candida pseudojiufengensis]KAI5963545.1 hypothetical protein KGF55_002425 [Candida pseudojiufengensis]
MSISTATQPTVLSHGSIKSSPKIISSPIQISSSSPKSSSLPKTSSIIANKINSLSTPLRSLTISNPTTEDQNNFQTNLKSNIILITKFTFKSETSNELSIQKGDILKLLDIPSNGWLLVKFIDKLKPPGLVPAQYVDIAINDPINPITLNWLHSTDSSLSSSNIIKDHKFLNLQFNKIESKFQTINNKPYPILVSISNFALFKQRYWYRLDVELSNKSKIYLCRYYQDFYNLHINLLKFLNDIPQEDKLEEDVDLKLPKLPEPLPTRLKHDENNSAIIEVEEEEEENINLLLKRCNDLNIYINKLILNKYFQTSMEIIDWLDLNYNNLPGFLEIDEIENDDINQKILPGSIDVVKNYNEKRLKLEEEEKKKANREEDEEENDDDRENNEDSDDENSEKEDLPSRTKSKNIYNNYQQASNVFRQNSNSIKRSQSKKVTSLTKTKSKSSSPISSTPNTSFNNNNSNISNTSINLNSKDSFIKENDNVTPNTSMDSNQFSNSPKLRRKMSQQQQSQQSQPSSSQHQHHQHQQQPKSMPTPPLPFSIQQQGMGTPTKTHQMVPNSPHYFQQQHPPHPNHPNHPHHNNYHHHQNQPQYPQNFQTVQPPPTHFIQNPNSPNSKPGYSSRNLNKNQSPQISPFPSTYYYNQSVPQPPPAQTSQYQNPKLSPLSINTKIFPISGYPTPNQTPISKQQSPITKQSKNPQQHPLKNNQILRCKIINLNQEVINISIPKFQILNIKTLKRVVFKKLNLIDSKHLLLMKLPNFKNFENLDLLVNKFNFDEFLKFNSEIDLKIGLI